ncbi:hypothetical protein FISHEDRAFT_69590 [Fistulina hepatica ATCC 64428]|uniref:Uncharacterized protein n=1 Tax=Fistulina hepatica ATCC 64428 TaxID=1128425 RepID=A0A0D7AM10_9AGAR|nr:hypothetical protein FISHEDRAFT_69590 [Fistulina hepatica ATCC 64428]
MSTSAPTMKPHSELLPLPLPQAVRSASRKRHELPRIPFELIAVILGHAWAQPMSNHTRERFFKTQCMVCFGWRDQFLRIAYRDVHITSYRAFLHLMRIMCKPDYPVLDYRVTKYPSQLCRSIYFRIEMKDLNPDSTKDDARQVGNALRDMMYDLQYRWRLMPQLRRVAIHYVNMNCDDLTVNHRLLHFPPQVTDLDVNFTITRTREMSNLDYRYRLALLRDPTPQDLPYVEMNLSHVRHLRVFGGSPWLLTAFLVNARYLDTVETDDYFKPGQILRPIRHIVTKATDP